MWLVSDLLSLGFFRLRRADRSALLAYVSIGLSSRTASREVLSPLQSLTSVFGMGTGGPSAFVTPTIFSNSSSLNIEQHYSTKTVLRLT